ncbi:MAG: pitrilysin family protein [Vicinamibacterales bacterium]
MPLAVARRVLPNGVTLVAARNRLIPAVSIAIGVDAGAIADPDGAPGTAALLARVLDRGTARYDAEAIADALESRGASLSVGASRQQIVASATCLVDDAAAVLPVACAVVKEPSLPEHEVTTRRGDLLTAIQEAADDPGSVAVDTLLSSLYPGGHPLGRPVRGTLEAVSVLSRQDLETFHLARFAPAATTVVAVGDLDAEGLLDRLSTEFQDWQGQAQALPPVATPAARQARALVVKPMPGKAQADVAYGFLGIARQDPDYYAALVMNNALGQYAMGGRLGDSIRERQGMAYYVYSALDAGREAGPLMVRAGVAADNVERTIASIDAELSSVLSGGFTATEVDDAKRYLIGSLPRQLETNGGIAGFLLAAEFYGLGIDHDVRLPRLIDAVTPDDVARVARRLLDPARAVVVVAGPWTGPAA